MLLNTVISIQRDTSLQRSRLCHLTRMISIQILIGTSMSIKVAFENTRLIHNNSVSFGYGFGVIFLRKLHRNRNSRIGEGISYCGDNNKVTN